MSDLDYECIDANSQKKTCFLLLQHYTINFSVFCCIHFESLETKGMHNLASKGMRNSSNLKLSTKRDYIVFLKVITIVITDKEEGE